MEEYLRRTSEIQISLLVRYLYKDTKNTQAIVNFFRNTAKLLNIPNPEYIETAVINYKKILPTPDEMVKISDLSHSRTQYYKSTIMQDMIGRNKFFELLKEAEPLEKMESLTNPLIADTLIEFLGKLKTLSKIIDEFLVDAYPND